MSNIYDYKSYERSAEFIDPVEGLRARENTDFDPFRGTAVQTHRLKAFCKILVNDHDITNKLDPYLLSIRVRDGIPQIGELELDDRDGRLPIPPKGSILRVMLGWKSEQLVKVFTGSIQDLEHSFGRKSGGRRMHIEARWDTTGHMKSPMQDIMGLGTPLGQKIGKLIPLSDFVSKVVANGKGKVNIHPIFKSIKRDVWEQAGKSPVETLAELAKEFNAEFRVGADGVSEFTIAGQRADGTPTNTVVAKWNDNLIQWRVHPWLARGQWGGAKQQFFDHASANWKTVSSLINAPGPWGGAVAKYLMPAPAPNSLVAGQHNDAVAEGANYLGKGRISINGEPTAKWQGFVHLVGARPGVDGLYLITCAEHVYNRNGYITQLDVLPWTRDGLPRNVILPSDAHPIVEAYKNIPPPPTNSPFMPNINAIPPIPPGPPTSSPFMPNINTLPPPPSIFYPNLETVPENFEPSPDENP